MDDFENFAAAGFIDLDGGLGFGEGVHFWECGMEGTNRKSEAMAGKIG